MLVLLEVKTMTEEKTKNMYLKTVFFPPKILKGIAFQINAGYFPNSADLVRYAVRKFLYGVMDFSFWPPKIKVGLEFIEDIPGKHEKERRTRAYELMKTHGIKSANRKLREEYGMGVSEKMLRLFDEEIRNNLKLENKKNVILVKEINHLAKEKLNPTPEIKIEPDKIKSPIIQKTEIVLDPKKESKPKKKDIAWDLAKNGKSIREIAKELIVSESAVYQFLNHKKKTLGLTKYPFSLKKTKRKKNPNLKQAWDLALEGYTIYKIAETMEMQEKSIYALLNKQRKILNLADYPFPLNPKKKKKEPLGNIYHPKPEAHKKVDANSLFDKNGNLLVSTRIISKTIMEEG